jgi:Mn2+/Fe2+ NRAMP family transporter
MTNMNLSKTLRIMGPGLLYAGAAIGVSHLVQSTRAGANFGFDLLWILLLANIIKYPFFEFGTRYAVATGDSLIEGYRRLGKWAIIAFALLTIATMFTIQAAVTIVTAGIAANVFGIEMDPVQLTAIILGITMLVLMIGRYTVLDRTIKIVIVILAVSTLVAVFSAIGKGPAADVNAALHFDWATDAHIFFLIAFIGWMPAPIDIAVWSSLWTVAKRKELKFSPTLRDSLNEFKVGYIGTIAMAICFLSLGALVLYGTGEELSPNGTVFAGQLITMYTSSIGNWAYWIIAIAALTTMFSTTLTCLDAYPRVLIPTTEILFPMVSQRMPHHRYLYWFWIIVVTAGALVLLKYFVSSMRFMVDLATTLSFLTAPVLAIMNFRVVTDKHMPLEARPGRNMRIYSRAGMVFLTAFTLFYVIWSLLVR